MASLEEIRDVRLAKLKALKDAGIDPYPADSRRTHTIAAALEDFEELSKKGQIVTLAGRVMSLRPQGALFFLHFTDGSGENAGTKIQALLKKEGTEGFDLFGQTVDIGDFIEVTGPLFVTKRNERSIEGSSWRMLSKSLRPLPEKWHGLQDVDERFRRRYLDALMSEEVRGRFLLRAKFIKELRKILDSEGFFEFETPILQPLAGGASAAPFKTHHNALDIDLYLRIAPELYLKMLLIAGYTKVYEIGRLFRNEGIDTTHNPEFTTVEWYEAYSDADHQMDFVEKVIKALIKKTVSASTVTFDGAEIDFSKKFARVSYFELLQRYAAIPNPESISRADLELKATQLGVTIAKGDGDEKIMDGIYKKACRPRLIQPTFITDYPKAFSPLAKKNPSDPAFVQKFQIVIGGFEVVNAFSELNDPIDQRERFTEQEDNAAKGDTEAQLKDEEYIQAMEYGMPPAGGLAISIDRMVMLLSNTKNIKEVIFFPTMRPRDTK